MIWDILFYIAVFNVTVWAILALFLGIVCAIASDNGEDTHRIFIRFVWCLVLMLLSQAVGSVAYVYSTSHAMPSPCSICTSKQQTASYASHTLKFFTETVADYINSPCTTPDCINFKPEPDTYGENDL